eukprot:TRINITY_DN9652_c0_g1_i2.p1 TRINITY_DN9652_c0_g1~~TRINITY_DN9652_c0_g1_i2.p1  ORF type:complete len:1534 (+),score=372.78 TRINITY_DN9652_c0_g1_i2:479-4603(+)
MPPPPVTPAEAGDAAELAARPTHDSASQRGSSPPRSPAGSLRCLECIEAPPWAAADPRPAGELSALQAAAGLRRKAGVMRCEIAGSVELRAVTFLMPLLACLLAFGAVPQVLLELDRRTLCHKPAEPPYACSASGRPPVANGSFVATWHGLVMWGPVMQVVWAYNGSSPGDKQLVFAEVAVEINVAGRVSRYETDGPQEIGCDFPYHKVPPTGRGWWPPLVPDYNDGMFPWLQDDDAAACRARVLPELPGSLLRRGVRVVPGAAHRDVNVSVTANITGLSNASKWNWSSVVVEAHVADPVFQVQTGLACMLVFANLLQLGRVLWWYRIAAEPLSELHWCVAVLLAACCFQALPVVTLAAGLDSDAPSSVGAEEGVAHVGLAADAAARGALLCLAATLAGASPRRWWLLGWVVVNFTVEVVASAAASLQPNRNWGRTSSDVLLDCLARADTCDYGAGEAFAGAHALLSLLWVSAVFHTLERARRRMRLQPAIVVRGERLLLPIVAMAARVLSFAGVVDAVSRMLGVPNSGGALFPYCFAVSITAHCVAQATLPGFARSDASRPPAPSDPAWIRERWPARWAHWLYTAPGALSLYYFVTAEEEDSFLDLQFTQPDEAPEEKAPAEMPAVEVQASLDEVVWRPLAEHRELRDRPTAWRAAGNTLFTLLAGFVLLVLAATTVPFSVPLCVIGIGLPLTYFSLIAVRASAHWLLEWLLEAAPPESPVVYPRAYVEHMRLRHYLMSAQSWRCWVYLVFIAGPLAFASIFIGGFGLPFDLLCGRGGRIWVTIIRWQRRAAVAMLSRPLGGTLAEGEEGDRDGPLVPSPFCFETCSDLCHLAYESYRQESEDATPSPAGSPAGSPTGEQQGSWWSRLTARSSVTAVSQTRESSDPATGEHHYRPLPSAPPAPSAPPPPGYQPPALPAGGCGQGDGVPSLAAPPAPWAQPHLQTDPRAGSTAATASVVARQAPRSGRSLWAVSAPVFRAVGAAVALKNRVVDVSRHGFQRVEPGCKVINGMQIVFGMRPERGLLCVAFRGTSNRENKIADINVIREPWDDMPQHSAPGGLSCLFACCSDSPQVHRGFTKLWNSLRSEVLSALQARLRLGGVRRIAVTGHSLGAAMAVLCACSLARRWDRNRVLLYTFGAPLIGNLAFSRRMRREVPHHWHVVYENDAISALAATLGNSHAGREVRLMRGGAFAVNPVSRELASTGWDFQGGGNPFAAHRIVRYQAALAAASAQLHALAESGGAHQRVVQVTVGEEDSFAADYGWAAEDTGGGVCCTGQGCALSVLLLQLPPNVAITPVGSKCHTGRVVGTTPQGFLVRMPPLQPGGPAQVVPFQTKDDTQGCCAYFFCCCCRCCCPRAPSGTEQQPLIQQPLL